MLLKTKWIALGCCLALSVSRAVRAAPPPIAASSGADPSGNGQPHDLDSFLSNLKRSNFLLGDMFGLRTFLSKYGISFAVQETSEVFGNATGGIRHTVEYDGLTQAVLQLDTNRAFGWYGGLFNVSALNIHGRNFSANNLDDIQTASGIEADRSTRLWELWYQQKFLLEDRLDVKLGQQSADQEFIVSTNAAYFVNTMFGWPALPSYDLPGGGPAYPLSAPAVRMRLRPIDPVNVLVGVFSGGPTSSNSGDPQQINASGTSFPLHNGTLVFTEVQYAYPSLGSMVYPGESAPLARTYKIGAWYDSQSFADLRVDGNGIPLASPASSGIAARHHGDWSLYAVADQMLWRNADDPNKTVNAFGRVMGATQADRNFLSFSMNLGLVMHEPIRYRAEDTFGVGMGYARLSSASVGYATDVAHFAEAANPGSFNPIPHAETYLEATYQFQARPWWQLQPDLQYVFKPGGGVADPAAPSQRIGNELVIGIRTNILF
jgi:porin